MAAADRFSRLAALRPASCPVRPLEPAPTREECPLASLLGGAVCRNRFGSHLAIRHWHATPSSCDPSAALVELLDPRPSGAPGRAFAEDPEKWLFLDTETT